MHWEKSCRHVPDTQSVLGRPSLSPHIPVWGQLRVPGKAPSRPAWRLGGNCEDFPMPTARPACGSGVSFALLQLWPAHIPCDAVCIAFFLLVQCFCSFPHWRSRVSFILSISEVSTSLTAFCPLSFLSAMLSSSLEYLKAFVNLEIMYVPLILFYDFTSILLLTFITVFFHS